MLKYSSATDRAKVSWLDSTGCDSIYVSILAAETRQKQRSDLRQV